MKGYARKIIIPVVFFVGASVVMTWPLILNLGHSVAGDLGDNVQYVWLIGWFEEALFRLHQSPFVAPHLNYPEGWSPAYTEMPVSMVLPILPISLVAGPVAAYNATILISYVLSGLVVYFWLMRETGNVYSSLIAGSIFAFSPYRYSHHLAGHLNLLGSQWIALYFMFFIWFLLDRKLRVAYPLLAAICLGLVGLTSQYYLYMALLLSLILLIVRFFWIVRWEAIDPHMWSRLGLFAAVGIPLVILVILPFLQLESIGDLPARSIEYVRQYSASPTDFLLPATTHILLGRWVGENFDRSYWIEATLYLGVIASVLAGIGVIKKVSSEKFQSKVILVLAFTIPAVVLALGTDLHWLSQPVWIKVPTFLRNWHPHELARIPLPGRALFEWFPYYDRMRVWMRYGGIVVLGVSVLAGYGSDWISGKFRGWRKSAVMALLLGLVLLDFFPRPQSFIKVEPRPVDEWLASQEAAGALVEFPIEKIADQAQLYYTLTHGKPFLGGSFNAFPPPQYRRIKPIMDAFPNRDSVELLRTLGVRYVLVHTNDYSNFEEINRRILEQGLHASVSMGGIQVYELELGHSEP
jgi:hypothetical protein